MDNIVVGERIKGLRLKRKMTREALAEAAGLSVSFLYEIETGRKSFSAYTLGNLSRALAVDSGYILLGDFQETAGKADGAPSRERLLCVQQMLMDAYDQIQNLIDP